MWCDVMRCSVLVLYRCVSRCIRFVVHGRPFFRFLFLFKKATIASRSTRKSTPTLQFQFVWNKSEICANEIALNHTKLARSRHRVCGSIQTIPLQTLAPNPTVAMREAWNFTLREGMMGLTRSHWFTSAVSSWRIIDDGSLRFWSASIQIPCGFRQLTTLAIWLT